MKKSGFTLVEVLMTLTIIGVITAIVLPQFVTNAHNQAHAAKLATIVADYENVFGTMMLKENADSIFDTEFGQAYIGNSSNTVSAMDNALRRYAKTTKSSTSTTDLGYLAYNKFTPFLPAVYAEDCEEICDSPSCEGYDEAFCFNNHCLNNYHPGAEGELGVCCQEGSSSGDYHWNEDTGTCEPNGNDPCIDSSSNTYNSVECQKSRCKAAFGMPTGDGTSTPFKCLSPLKPLTPADAPSTVMHTISNVPVGSDIFSFVAGTETAGGANIFFKSPEIYSTEENEEYRASTVFIDVNGGASPNKFGRDVFAFILDEDGHLLPYGSESAATTLGLSVENDANTWKTNNITFGCTGSGYNGLGCTARLKENNYKVNY